MSSYASAITSILPFNVHGRRERRTGCKSQPTTPIPRRRKSIRHPTTYSPKRWSARMTALPLTGLKYDHERPCHSPGCRAWTNTSVKALIALNKIAAVATNTPAPRIPTNGTQRQPGRCASRRQANGYRQSNDARPLLRSHASPDRHG